MLAFVYKSGRKADTYVYLRDRDGFGLIPAPLREQLGPLELVMELDLSPPRRLARVDAEQVRASLAGPGFHLQLPPRQPDLLDGRS